MNLVSPAYLKDSAGKKLKTACIHEVKDALVIFSFYSKDFQLVQIHDWF